ncbi:MAG: response regulator [Planctomycetes bacterium]|nr:response regulator [Planctomycetota bacterium]
MQPFVRVLIVDDNAADLALLAEALALEPGLEVLKATSVDIALRLLQEHVAPDGSLGIHFVLMDLNMPGRNGLDALKAISDSPVLRNVAVVVMTSSARDVDRNACKALGALDVWKKPMLWDDCVAIAGIAATTARSVRVDPGSKAAFAAHA